MIRNVLVISDLRGRLDVLEPLAERCREHGCEAVLVAGNIFSPGLRAEEWARAQAEGRAPAAPEAALHQEEEKNSQVLDTFLDWLSKLNVPAFLVPGALDAPERLFVQGVTDHTSISPRVVLVHRGFAELGTQHVVAGYDAGSIHVGTSLVVWPGRLDQGHYAVVDLHERVAVFGHLAEEKVA